MTLSLSANSVATFFHQVLKSEVEVMMLPSLQAVSHHMPPFSSNCIHLQTSVVVGVKDSVGTAVGNEFDSLCNQLVLQRPTISGA